MNPYRVIGIVRVSETGDRTPDRLRSPGEQVKAMEAFCEAQGWRLLRTVEELDVSGTLPLKRRPYLAAALDDLGAGRAEVILTHYFDRLVRGMGRQSELIEQVEAIDGAQLWSVDSGRLTNLDAADKLRVNAGGMVAQYQSDAARERSWAAVETAIAEGVGGFAKVPLGYRLGDDRRLYVDPDTAPLVVAAFELRAGGAPLRAVRDLLREHGVERAVSTMRTMLASRVYLGELHFGDHTPNLRAHAPIVDRALFDRAQRATGPARGTQPPSDRLLARLGVLRCAACGARMVVGTSNGRNGSGYPIYRCPPYSDCERRTSISAPMIEGIVVDEVRAVLADVQGRASAVAEAREAEEAVERAQQALDGAIAAFTGLEGEPAAVERLGELRRARDDARERADRLLGSSAALTVAPAADWDRATVAERRAFIRATIDTVKVARGRGTGRVTVQLLGE